MLWHKFTFKLLSNERPCNAQETIECYLSGGQKIKVLRNFLNSLSQSEASSTFLLNLDRAYSDYSSFFMEKKKVET